MDIKNYEITGVGPDGRTFDSIRTNGNKKVVVSDLREGVWAITVTGLNEDDQAVGEGAKEVTVVGGKEVTTTVLIEEFAGEGSFSIEVNWPKHEIANPQVLVSLKNVLNGEAVNYSAEAAANGDSLTL